MNGNADPEDSLYPKSLQVPSCNTLSLGHSQPRRGIIEEVFRADSHIAFYGIMGGIDSQWTLRVVPKASTKARCP